MDSKETIVAHRRRYDLAYNVLNPTQSKSDFRSELRVDVLTPGGNTAT